LIGSNSDTRRRGAVRGGTRWAARLVRDVDQHRAHHHHIHALVRQGWGDGVTSNQTEADARPGTLGECIGGDVERNDTAELPDAATRLEREKTERPNLTSSNPR
jgi:hypothetical protein